jgi:hypothetical protein
MRSKGVNRALVRRVTDFYQHAHGRSFKEILESPTMPQMPSDMIVELHTQLYRALMQNW